VHAGHTLLLSALVGFVGCSGNKTITASSVSIATLPPFVELDAHVHVFREGIDSKVVLPLLDAAHVHRAALISAGYATHDLEKARGENDFVAREVKANPRFSGYCGVHPLEPWALEELERCSSTLGLMGVKLHVNEQGLDLTKDEHVAAVERVVAAAEAADLVVLVHVDKTWRVMVKLADKHPGVRIVLAHALLHEHRDLTYLGMRFEIAKKRGGKLPPNLFADVSSLITFYSSSPFREEILWELRSFGTDRLLFGSDLPLWTPEEALKALSAYAFTESELRAILVENPRRIFRLVEPSK
jgi:predicted TIM-barrel fold metal-dependent hydrolase